MRGFYTVFHQTGTSSLRSSVEPVWKLCKKSSKRRIRPDFSPASAVQETYFGHEQCCGKRMRIRQLARFSTFPNHLLLLLVL
jgi:hypothetical protein